MFNRICKDILCEKATRQALKSAVESTVNSDTVVILDSLNYNENFCYELAGIAKSRGTHHCVLWVERDFVDADEKNKDRIENEQCDQEM